MSIESKAASSTLRIDRERLQRELHELSRIGFSEEDHGIYRMAFTEADMEGKQWVQDRLEAAGLETWRDGAANVWGRLSGANPELPAVVIGSHLDTVPSAGSLDGALGVLTGVECLRRLKEEGITPERTVEVVAFSDEEGRFGGMLGSEAVVGRVSPERLHDRDLDGVSLASAMRDRNLDPRAILDAARDPRKIHRYIELHIEQGPVLTAQGISVGVVEEITGLFKWAVVLRGASNHAGTTPMDMRRDAFMGLADFAHELPRILEENGTELSRATIGKAQIVPGAPNTVPGLVEFSLDVRDTRSEMLDELANACRKVLSAIARRRQLMFEFEELSRIEPVACDPEVIEAIEASAAHLELESLRMPSGAAHDAQIMAHIARVGMIFVPSRDGVSHSPAEWTSTNDIDAGANLTLHTVLALARGDAKS